MTGEPQRAAVVFAGGEGTRLWPWSRESVPKQFLPIGSHGSLLAETVGRLSTVLPLEQIYVSTQERFRDVVVEHLPDLPPENLLLEEGRKGSAAAYVLAHAHLLRRHGNIPVLTCPADHFIGDPGPLLSGYAEMFAAAEANPQDPVVLGSPALRADPTFGYLQVAEACDERPPRVESFLEKPATDVAQGLVDSRRAFWNLAHYVAHPAAVLAAYRDRRPTITAAVEAHVEQGAGTAYPGPASRGSELLALFEHGSRPVLVVREVDWSDVGTWPRTLDVLRAEGTGSVGPVTQVDSPNTVVINEGERQIVTLGVQDVVVVAHGDAVYIMDSDALGDDGRLDAWRATLSERNEDLL